MRLVNQQKVVFVLIGKEAGQTHARIEGVVVVADHDVRIEREV
ncbi:hypothetical protein SDC9_179125 [bioreactor metagenome]|uniref:Uncharacterized protein n=1 Tax=bioreactor metagenome TaxID=1076179 RepID=A0A645GXQ2_9ZZZZ